MNLLLRDDQTGDRLNYIEERLGPDWRVDPWRRADGKAAYAQALAKADAVVGMKFAGTAEPLPHLRLIQIPGAGFDLVDFSAVPPQCAVCNVFEHEIPMAEYLLLGMLEMVIRMGRMSAGLRQGQWNDGGNRGTPIHGELFGKTAGFIGYGHIGQETAKRLDSFGVRTIACTRSPGKGGAFAERVAGMDELPWLLSESDFVIVACPLTESTRGLIGATQLAMMKPQAVLLNVARSAVVDDGALFAACESGRLAGAVLDVWTHYPKAPAQTMFPSDHPFHTLDNVIMTPHASGWTDGLWDRRWQAICDNLNRLAQGQELHNVLMAPGGPPPV